MYAIIKKTITTFVFATVISVTSWSQADIVDLKDLVADAEDAVWTDNDGNELTMGNLSGLNRVSRGAKLGGIHGSSFSRSGKLDIDKTFSKETVDIRLSPTLNDSPSKITGTYSLNLPDFKRIQLELRHDAFLDRFGSQSTLQFYVEVLTKDEQGLFNHAVVLDVGIDPVKESNRRVYQIDKNETETEAFTSNPAIIDLTEWAGQSIQLNLVSFLPAGARATNEGRWVNARLVGATFNFHFGEIEEVDRTINQAFGKVLQPRTSGVQIASSTVQNLGATQTIDIDDIRTYPDTALTSVNVDGTWYGYFHAQRTHTTPWDDGTAAFDLSDFSTYNLFSISEANLEDSLLREGSPNPTPGSSGAAYRVLHPIEPEDLTSFYNSYAGIGGAVVETNGSNDKVHAVFHAEDWSHSGTSLNDPHFIYNRIGYARGDTNSGYDFTVIPNDDGDPIIECFQPESAVDGSRHSNGNGGPHMIASGDYYYCFYTRWLDTTDPINWTMPSTSIIGGTWDQICVARALKSNVHNQDHDQDANPWKKYHNGSWTSDGLGGFSTPVINENWRAFPKIIYASGYSEHFLVCTGSDGLYFHTQSSSNMEDWDNGMLLLTDPAVGAYLFPSLIGNGGDSAVGGTSEFQLYFGYDEDDTPGGEKMVRRQIEFDK